MSGRDGKSAITRLRVKDKGFAIVAGAVFFLVGSWFLFQAWEARGQKPPAVVRPFTWF